ncbi:bacteriohemerythrin [Geomonas paludis]|uniref:Hemerythrin n=1 Tax=Geomonas paludis TaxID=2740185 RepID=A0A6V8N180_9BACT|nr:bacteriohemerythrin [Geomonas paludis]UPU36361.1 bacteriohemerythrin [Geomonas paludis]GFO65814.1 hemerythrin [Geomonas paludis]
MTLVEWDDTLILGMPQIDEDHHKLVNILNRCYRALMLHDHSHELQEVVAELLDYTQYHFATEEQLMAQLHYAAAPSHAAAHRKFINSIHNFKDRSDAGESFVAIDVLVFLKDWLVGHIQNTDRAFTNFISERTEL